MSSVTVIIPTYNSAAFLEETVQSVLAQTDPPERIVIVDDSSPDDSFALAQRLAETHAGIMAVERPNGGAGAARNTGLTHADTDFILFLDADDRLLPEAVARHLDVFRQHPETAMVFGANHLIDTDGTRTGSNPVAEQAVSRADIALHATPCPSQCLYRRAAVMAAGGFNESLRPGDEIDLNLRLAAQADLRAHSHFVMEYRLHPNQGTRNVKNVADEHLRALALNLGPAAPQPDPALHRRARRKWQVHYGRHQHRVALGALRHGRWPEIWPATQLAAHGAWARLAGLE